MTAAELCRRLADAMNARDWGTAATMIDARTVVDDHRDLPFEGDGARMLGIWRSTFDAISTGRVEFDVLEQTPALALVRAGFGDEQGKLVVYGIVEVAGDHMARFDAYARDQAGERDARAAFSARR
jgi:hypothetical protein